MGLLDEILKQLEEAQNEGKPRPRPLPARRPERELDEDGDDEVVEPERPGQAPRIPSRRHAHEADAPEPAPVRTTADSRPAIAPHERGVASAAHIRALLTNRSSIRDALILREILGPPPGMRRIRR